VTAQTLLSVQFFTNRQVTLVGDRELLSSAQRAQLLSSPSNLGELEKFYTLTPADRDFIAGHRTESNRIGVAVQLCFLRYPGRAWTPEESLPATMLGDPLSQILTEASSGCESQKLPILSAQF
jgi:TnpA family transposase